MTNMELARQGAILQSQAINNPLAAADRFKRKISLQRRAAEKQAIRASMKGVDSGIAAELTVKNIPPFVKNITGMSLEIKYDTKTGTFSIFPSFYAEVSAPSGYGVYGGILFNLKSLGEYTFKAYSYTDPVMGSISVNNSKEFDGLYDFSGQIESEESIYIPGEGYKTTFILDFKADSVDVALLASEVNLEGIVTAKLEFDSKGNLFIPNPDAFASKRKALFNSLEKLEPPKEPQAALAMDVLEELQENTAVKLEEGEKKDTARKVGLAALIIPGALLWWLMREKKA